LRKPPLKSGTKVTLGLTPPTSKGLSAIVGNGSEKRLGRAGLGGGRHQIVTMPGTSYSVTYHKRNDPWVFASNIRDDHNSPISKWTFRARAWIAANEKARELGWIV